LVPPEFRPWNGATHFNLYYRLYMPMPQEIANSDGINLYTRQNLALTLLLRSRYIICGPELWWLDNFN